MRRTVKAEILWTRACPLSCGYCAMYYNKKDGKIPKLEKNWDLWKKGLENLKALDCGFTAVYGAEPLADMKYLPDYFSETNRLGILHTLITSCVVPNVREKLTELQKHGLRSLTVSFDGNEKEIDDPSSIKKSGVGIETLRWFQSEYKNQIRDASVVFTLTKTNLFSIIKWIPVLAKENIFVFFDLIHNDIGNPGTKVRNYPGIEKLLFTMDDAPILQEFGIKLKELKDRGSHTIHQSDSFIKVLIETPEIYIKKQWNCATESVFPSWLTINYDGTAFICDDFQIYDGPNWKFWDLTPDVFDGEFTNYWKEQTLKNVKVASGIHILILT